MVFLDAERLRDCDAARRHGRPNLTPLDAIPIGPHRAQKRGLQGKNTAKKINAFFAELFAYIL